jgi:hypothetical protein
LRVGTLPVINGKHTFSGGHAARSERITPIITEQDDSGNLRVMQRLFTLHNGASLYKAFSAEEALRIHKKLEKLEFHYTPKHASWSNMAEIEIHALGKQCIDKRIGDVDTLKREIAIWERDRNQRQVNVNWQFTVDKARSKFQRSYDKLNI